MSFQEILDNLIERVPESIAATFNDKDGDPICARTIEVPNEALQLLGPTATWWTGTCARPSRISTGARWSRWPSAPASTGSS